MFYQVKIFRSILNKFNNQERKDTYKKIFRILNPYLLEWIKKPLDKKETSFNR